MAYNSPYETTCYVRHVGHGKEWIGLKGEGGREQPKTAFEIGVITFTRDRE
jgi:hypothetical protein